MLIKQNIEKENLQKLNMLKHTYSDFDHLKSYKKCNAIPKQIFWFSWVN